MSPFVILVSAASFVSAGVISTITFTATENTPTRTHTGFTTTSFGSVVPGDFTHTANGANITPTTALFGNYPPEIVPRAEQQGPFDNLAAAAKAYAIAHGYGVGSDGCIDGHDGICFDTHVKRSEATPAPVFPRAELNGPFDNIAAAAQSYAVAHGYGIGSDGCIDGNDGICFDTHVKRNPDPTVSH